MDGFDRAFGAADQAVNRIGFGNAPGLDQLGQVADRIGFGVFGQPSGAQHIGYGSALGSGSSGSPQQARRIGGYDDFLQGTYASYLAGTQQRWNDLLGQTPASPAPTGADWAGVNQWSSAIQQASSKTGVPANLIRAVMKLESGGANAPMNGAGAVGPMQVVASIWSGLGYDLNDPNQNIMAGATILKQMRDQYAGWAQQNGVDPWQAAVYSYYAGNPYNLSARDNPAQGGSGMSTGDYGAQIWRDYQALNSGAQAFDENPSAGSSGGSFNQIWGGFAAPITQEFGPTDWSMGQGAYMYGYGADYGVQGHPGVDVGVPYGTQLYSPVGGTVTISGGSGYYCNGDYKSCGPGAGELMIQLDNGDQVILGHMSQITVPVGTRVNAGQFVGRSGAENGAHVHVEYRKVTPGATSTGYTIIDPRTALGGMATGSYSGGVAQQPTAPQAMSLNQVMLALLQGQSVPGYSF